MAYEHLGKPLTGGYVFPGGMARIYERGAVINDQGGEVVVTFNLPMIGVPHIAVGNTDGAMPLGQHAFTFQAREWDLALKGVTIRNALSERIALLPTGEAPNPTPLTFGAPEVVPALESTHGLPSAASLRERQLYDVGVRLDDGQWTVIAPNAIYYRSSWHDFGIAHITDIHLARRIDYLPGMLEQLGQADGAQRFYNWNDRFRGFIKYANYLHSIGVLDVILATGDIIDYLFEDDDDPNGGGNAHFARELILGKWASAGFEDVGPLRVPIFMVPGNHDYRRNRYRFVFNLDVGPFNVKQIQNYSPYNLNWKQGLALSRGDNGDDVPELSAETAAKMVEVDPLNLPYTNYLADDRFYVVQLGEHRIVMLDSSCDVGIVTGKVEGLLASLGMAEEDERTFVGGAPNSEGVTEAELKLVAEALDKTPTDALVIVGLHAPLFNPWAERYPWYLRETQRPAQSHLIVPHLGLYDLSLPSESGLLVTMRSRHPLWFAPEGAPEPTYVKRGDNDDRFDYGVSRGKAVELLRLIAGIGSRRRADVVLHGHVHRFNEFRIGVVDGELAYFMDFYTQNPPRYYPTRFPRIFEGGVVSDVTYVEVADNAPANAEPLAMPTEARHKFVVQVPPYPKSLATAPDARTWWAEHRPLILQSEAYGPIKDPEVSFSGFRLLSVKGDVIEKIHFIPTQRLHESGYRLPFEEAIKPVAPRRYQHVQRSRAYNRAEAVGNPCGYLPPAGGLQNIIYRDTQNDILELWRGGSSTTGTGNLTRACNGPGASGDPFVYLEPPTGTQIALFRGVDGHVNSIYWSTGDVGYDHLTASVGAPKAVGNPIGYFETAANTNHVIYRKADSNLHELWWTGQAAVSHGDITGLAGALKATGDPTAFYDSTSATNVVFYRATDGHIHSLYWSTGPIGHDNLSGFAQAPKAAGDPHAYYTAHNNANQVVYRGVDGHIHELWWVGAEVVSHWDISAIAGAPTSGSDPVSFYSPHTNTKHVFYRATDGHLIELWWFPGGGAPAFVDLTVEAWAPVAVGKPSAFADGPYRHVVFRAADNHIHEIRFW